jgi:hypothetical protein
VKREKNMSANVAYKPHGLDSLLLEEDDIRSYEESKGDAGGIADLGPIRERMEKAGRYGDDRVAHVQTGELVVPKPLIDKFPELKASIFEHLREMGVEDPERYMVGDDENSINPETGLPEFGFFSSVVRGIKSVVKSVSKVVKKVAPTLIKIAGTVLLQPIMGPIAAAAVSGGIASLVGGGSLKDAAIAAALGGATGALAPSIGSVAAMGLQGGAEAAIAGGNFGDVLKGAGIGAAGAAAGKIFAPTLKNILPEGAGGETIKDPFKTGVDALSSDIGRTGTFFSDVTSGEISKAFEPSVKAFSDFGSLGDVLKQGTPATVEGDFFPEAGYPPVKNVAMPPKTGFSAAMAAISPAATGAPGASNAAPDLILADAGDDLLFEAPIATYLGTDIPVVEGYGDANFMNAGYQPEVPPPQARSFLDKVRAEPFKTLFTGEEKLTTSSPIYQDAYKAKFNELTRLGEDRVIALSQAKAHAENVLKEAQPGFFARNPYLLTGAAVAAPFASKLFEVPEMEKPNILPSGFGQQGIDPELVAKYRLSESSLSPPTRTSPISAKVAPRRQSETLRRRFPDLFAAKDGGGVFPRRTGGIMPDEGVPGKDSVRAMVMPGEFIFTTDAVRGASPTGNLRDGINNMYSVMRRLESRGKRMA